MRIRSSYVLLAGMFVGFGAVQASEMTEVENNHPIGNAQEITFSGDSVTIAGFVDNMPCMRPGDMNDVDFFKFRAQKDDVVTFDIDHGQGGEKSVDLEMAVFRDGDFRMEARNEDLEGHLPLDEGSTSRFDPRIDEFEVLETGHYIVGVTTDNRNFQHGGSTEFPCIFQPKGDYTLVISGVTPEVLNIGIEIKPSTGANETGQGASASKDKSGKLRPLNYKSKGKIPVALLSSPDFEPTLVDQDRESLTFGRTGEERSLSRCPSRRDVNGDGRLDLVCMFEAEVAGFGPDDTSGFVRGQTVDGTPFKGRGLYEPVPGKRVPGDQRR